jgi:hypothetical protein
MHLFMYAQVKANPKKTPMNMPPKTANSRLAKPFTESLGLGHRNHQATTIEAAGHAKTQADCGQRMECQKPPPDSNHALEAIYQAAGSATDRHASRVNLKVSAVKRLLVPCEFKCVTGTFMCGLTFDMRGGRGR